MRRREGDRRAGRGQIAERIKERLGLTEEQVARIKAARAPIDEFISHAIERLGERWEAK